MLNIASGGTRIDRIQNKNIRWTVHVRGSENDAKENEAVRTCPSVKTEYIREKKGRFKYVVEKNTKLLVFRGVDA